MAAAMPSFFMAKDFQISGTSQEVKSFNEVYGHYTMANADLTTRIHRKNGFDDADKMFASYIDEQGWPYKSMMFDPRPYTILIEKSARLIGSKPKGRLVPREGGDALGAQVNNELLSFQWDDNTRLGESMISKLIRMDKKARKYGSSFGICKWNYTRQIEQEKGKAKSITFYDGPDFLPCNPRDVLANPSYTSIKKWFQYREYVTLDELEDTNDSSRSGPVYKNLDKLRIEMSKDKTSGVGDKRESNYIPKNKAMRGLTDYLGSDKLYKTIEIITEYRPDRWITFAPRHGVIIRDIPNPYKHGEIPVAMLRYYPLPDDLYGVGEFEPVARLIRGNNALFSQYIDNITVDLYPPLMVNPVNVRMHTLEFAPEAKWLMNQPGVDVVRLQTSTAATNNFQAAYQIMVGSLLSAWGEGSQGMSSMNPATDTGRVTATEIRDTSFTRNVRDNMNLIFLSDALKKQIMFWHSMNQQLMFQGATEKMKIVRIVGRDAIDFFTQAGLGDIRPTQQDAQLMAEQQAAGQTPTPVPPGPRFPVGLGNGLEAPKFQPDQIGNGGNLIIEPGDLIGDYDYIPDIEAMKAPSQDQVENKLMAMLGVISNPVILQQLAAEGRQPKVEDILVRAFESTGVIKDASSLFEDLKQPAQMPGIPGQPQPNVQQTNAGGGQVPAAGVPNQGNGGNTGLAGSVPPLAPGQNQALMGGPA